jgi:hypothetical protein
MISFNINKPISSTEGLDTCKLDVHEAVLIAISLVEGAEDLVRGEGHTAAGAERRKENAFAIGRLDHRRYRVR